MTVPLPLPDDPRLPGLIATWPIAYATPGLYAYPRSRWLRDFEDVLREHYPQASSKQLTLTARLTAPFPLAKPNVP